jgi:hypothetical protein
MGIKDDLARDRAKFISLHKVLLAICSAEECSYEDAAAWLYARLGEAYTTGTPRWYRDLWPSAPIPLTSASASAANQALSMAAKYGDPDKGWCDDDIPF